VAVIGGDGRVVCTYSVYDLGIVRHADVGDGTSCPSVCALGKWRYHIGFLQHLGSFARRTPGRRGGCFLWCRLGRVRAGGPLWGPAVFLLLAVSFPSGLSLAFSLSRSLPSASPGACLAGCGGPYPCTCCRCFDGIWAPAGAPATHYIPPRWTRGSAAASAERWWPEALWHISGASADW